jgi:uncharacterized membrane protein YedE/YeeE
VKQRYADPYIAGVGLGFVLLAAFVFAGRGLGASGAFNSIAAAAADGAGIATRDNPAFAPYLTDGGPARDWLVYEIAGVIIGAFLSARFAGRLSFTTERGPHITDRSRWIAAFAGGALMGVGARFARGCTSGQALTGGALLSVGSWIFILTCFAAAFAVAPLVRRQWL